MHLQFYLILFACKYQFHLTVNNKTRIQLPFLKFVKKFSLIRKFQKVSSAVRKHFLHSEQ